MRVYSSTNTWSTFKNNHSRRSFAFIDPFIAELGEQGLQMPCTPKARHASAHNNDCPPCTSFDLRIWYGSSGVRHFDAPEIDVSIPHEPGVCDLCQVEVASVSCTPSCFFYADIHQWVLSPKAKYSIANVEIDADLRMSDVIP